MLEIRLWVEEHKGVIMAVVVVITVVLFVGVLVMRHSNVQQKSSQEEPSSEFSSIKAQIADAVEKGEWGKMVNLLLDLRQRTKNDFPALRDEIDPPLEINVERHYIIHKGQPVEQAKEYWLELNPRFPSEFYLYVLEQNPRGTLQLLFPNKKYTKLENPVIGSVRIPENYSKTLSIEEPGDYTIYVIASWWRLKKLEELISGGVQTYKSEILKLLNVLYDKYATDIRGISVGKYQFKHVVPMSARRKPRPSRPQQVFIPPVARPKPRPSRPPPPPRSSAGGDSETVEAPPPPVEAPPKPPPKPPPVAPPARPVDKESASQPARPSTSGSEVAPGASPTAMHGAQPERGETPPPPAKPRREE